MNRLGTTPPSELHGEGKAKYDELSQICEDNFGRNGDVGVYKRPDGAFIGPFAPLLCTPGVIGPFFGLLPALAELKGLPVQAREVAILTVGGKYQAAYENYAHGLLGAKVGLSQLGIDQLVNGTRPESLDAMCQTSFDVAHALVNIPRPLSNDLWNRAVEAFGVDGATALIHYVGFYSYTCTVLNGFAVTRPDGTD